MGFQKSSNKEGAREAVGIVKLCLYGNSTGPLFLRRMFDLLAVASKKHYLIQQRGE